MPNELLTSVGQFSSQQRKLIDSLFGGLPTNLKSLLSTSFAGRMSADVLSMSEKINKDVFRSTRCRPKNRHVVFSTFFLFRLKQIDFARRRELPYESYKNFDTFCYERDYFFVLLFTISSRVNLVETFGKWLFWFIESQCQ